jgi:DNA-binding NarL/FixJ family response regulator
MNRTDCRAEIHVQVAHPDPYLAAGITALLQANALFTVQARHGAPCAADVVVADYETAVAACPAPSPSSVAVRRSATPCLVVTSHRGSWHVRRAIDAGVRGYVLDDCSAGELSAAVSALAGGARYIPIPIAEKLAESLAHPIPTAREMAVLELLAAGMSNKDISHRLRIGEGTVKTHMKALLDKLGVASRTGAVSEAVRRGLVQGD